MKLNFRNDGLVEMTNPSGYNQPIGVAIRQEGTKNAPIYSAYFCEGTIISSPSLPNLQQQVTEYINKFYSQFYGTI